MPRKTNYKPDYDENYDDDYDAYDDYDGYDDYDYGSSKQESGKTYEEGKKINRPVLWSCSICTYDNDQSLVYCEICGVLREPSIAPGKDGPVKVFADAASNATEKRRTTKVKQKHGISANSRTLLSQLSQLGVGDSSPTPYNMSQPDNRSSLLSDKRPIDRSTASLATANMLDENKGNNANINKNTPQTLANDPDRLRLDKSLATNRKEDTLADCKLEKGLPHDQGHRTHNQLNLAIVGHVDSGKSTLSGRLLHLMGRISKKEMHKYEKEAKEKGKGSFSYAWAMDESAEERERGITMTVAIAYFDSRNYHVVLLDSPGHKDFVPNMIAGATQADAAVLVVDASVGSFEAGMDGGGFGQTREHAQLIRSFGVEQLIVAVNKMDLVGYSNERFDFIKAQLGSFLRSCGFKESAIAWIPLSVIENQNLVKPASDTRLSSWYCGLCFLDQIDTLQPPVRDVTKPLRLPICDVTRLHTLGQVAVSGKLEAGIVQNGSKVLIMPSGHLATVRSIERDASACSSAGAGDNVAISLQGIDSVHLMAGGVLCHPHFPVAIATRLELKVLVLDITIPIITGTHVEFHIHHAKEAARIVKIVSLLDPKTGKVAKSSPRVLKAKQSAIIVVELDVPVCVEEFSKCKALGRAFLRSSGNTIAVGIVTRVFDQNE
ncbi:Elongation factor 1-alpha C [Apostasia shenzhenica]|uniref:Elongation factor 1-alpha C n=1 Tax=Apostasia shenzhenica TaxID=1088818 RepID=A0A2I0A393_9ASPA|nr:Elongation factor 1-alpha C [Apostasia shenzhenica]